MLAVHQPLLMALSCAELGSGGVREGLLLRKAARQLFNSRKKNYFLASPKCNSICQRRQQLLSSMWEWRGKQQAALSFSGNPREKGENMEVLHRTLGMRFGKYTVCWNFSLFPSEMFMIQNDQCPPPFFQLLHSAGKSKQSPGPRLGLLWQMCKGREGWPGQFPFCSINDQGSNQDY